MAKDIIFTDDINISNGDLVVDISDIQHVEHIIKSNTGQYYQYPSLGYGVNAKLNGSFNAQQETTLMKQQIESDNNTVSKIDIIPNQSNFSVDVKFKRNID